MRYIFKLHPAFVMLLAGFTQDARAQEPRPILPAQARVSPAVATIPLRPTANQIDLSSAAKLTLRFQGYPDLSGDYRVNPDETITIPVLGRISVSSMTPAQLEQLLARKISEVTGRENYVTVEIAGFGPVFITGLVKNPGSIQWQPGMTVLQSIALVGGLFRPETSRQDTTGEPDKTRLKKSIDDQKRTMATIARLRAERDDLTTIPIPAELVSLVGQREAEQLIIAQTSLFLSRRSSLEAQSATLERGRILADQQLAGLELQSHRVDELLRMRRDTRAKVQDLLAKGYVRADRGFEEDLRISELEEKSVNISVAITQVQSTQARLERDKVLLTQDRRAQIDGELATLERTLAQLDIDLESMKDMSLKNSSDNIALAASSNRSTTKYVIIRQDVDGTREVVAGASSSLKQGDVLVVSQEATDG